MSASVGDNKEGRKEPVGEKEEDPEEDVCSICLDKVSQPGKARPCDHIFCLACIFIWLEVHEQCAMCRQNIVKVDCNASDIPSKTSLEEIDAELIDSMDSKWGPHGDEFAEGISELVLVRFKDGSSYVYRN